MMRVYVENTHHEDILKFICDETLTTGSLELTNSDDLSSSLLAQEVLQFPFINKVYITANFVALQKESSIEWEIVVEDLKELINKHLNKGTIVLEAQKEDPITVYAEMTPNPAVMKFVANKLLVDGIVEIRSKEEAKQVPLALALFDFPFVKEVFFTENYLSVTKNETSEWNELALELRNFILTYLKKGKKVINDDFVPASKTFENVTPKTEFSSVEKQIKAIIKEYIQPAVAGDGGNIELMEFDESTKTAKMLLQGACSGCPSSTITLKNGIENMLKEMMPNVVENVEAING